jgi:hypothetical protein
LGYRFTDEQRKRTSAGHIGISQSDETKKIKSDMFRGRLPWNTGKSGYTTKKAIPIIQYDLQGNFIKEWPSQQVAAGVLSIQNLNRHLKGGRKSAGGFVWKYKFDKAVA